MWRRRGKFERKIEDSVLSERGEESSVVFELDTLSLRETFFLGVARCFDNLFIVFIYR